MTMTEPQGRGTIAAGSITAVAMMAQSVLVYLFTLFAAHTLGPEHFGGVSAFLGILLVANVGALALQATAARRTATCEPEEQGEVAREALHSTRQTTILLTAVLLLASPLVAYLLHISLLAALMAPATIAPLTLAGGFAGILQGTQRWSWLAAVFVAIGAGRLLFGALGIYLYGSIEGATVGLAIGAAMPAVIGWWGTRFVSRTGERGHHRLLHEVWKNGQSLLAFFVLTNLDVIIARNRFPATNAGIYAAGGVLAKMCLFLPQFVIVVAFTKMAKDHAADADDQQWLRPLGFVAALGAMVVAGTAVLPQLAVLFIGGSEYSRLESFAWLFALEGTIFAMLQMVVYRQIARQAKIARYLWVTSSAIVLVGMFAPIKVPTLVIAVIVIAVIGAVPTAMARSHLPAPAPTDSA
jgi:O-antigen/teichoic acid export membrane protein